MTGYSDDSSMDDDSLRESHVYNRKTLEQKLSSFDDHFGNNESSPTRATASSVNHNSVVGLHDSHNSQDSLYFDGEEEKKNTKKQTKKGQPSFNQGGALEILMTPAAKKKPSAAAKMKPSAAATLVLPKTLAKHRKDSGTNLSCKVENTLDKLGSSMHNKKKSSKKSLNSPAAETQKANANDLWDRLGKGSGHGSAGKHRRSKSNTVPDLTDECGFVIEPGSPDAMSSSAHRNTNSAGEIPRNSRRGGRRNGQANQMGSPTTELTKSPAARKGASRRRRDMDRSSSHRQNGDRLRSSSHGPGDRQAQSPMTPRARNRSIGKVTAKPSFERSQSAHVSTTDTPVKRRMRRRGSGSMGPQIDMPFNSPGSVTKEGVNAADFLSASKGVMSSPPEGGKRAVMRGRRPSQRGNAGSDELRASSYHGPPPQRNGSIKSRNNSGGGRRRQRSRDPAVVNAGVR
mmetsp:Transcript_7619/g.18354  ORF Transcript_7619/g.18354 Transcript_7619/m.18354 type:complete len:457 (-) Transcript_7619:160-1530(-)